MACVARQATARAEDAQGAEPTTGAPASVRGSTAAPDPAEPGRRIDEPPKPGSTADDRELKAAAEAPVGSKVPERRWGKLRELDGHRFPLPAFTPTAFTITHFGIRAGVESRQTPDYPTRPLAGQAVQLVDLHEIDVSQTLDFAFRFHDVVALVGDAYGMARVGTDVPTLTGAGAQYRYGADLGALLKVFRSEASGTQIAVRATGGFYAGQTVSVRTLSDQVRDSVVRSIREQQSGSSLDPIIARVERLLNTADLFLLTPYSAGRFAGYLTVAQALGQVVGVQAAFGMEFEQGVAHPTQPDGSGNVVPVAREIRTTMVTPSVSVALDVDFEKFDFPIDVSAEYALRVPTTTRDVDGVSSSNTDGQHVLALGIYYSGRRDFQLGVLGYNVLGLDPIVGAGGASSGRPSDLGGQFVLRYLW